jgi:hypothetical protein
MAAMMAKTTFVVTYGTLRIPLVNAEVPCTAWK